MKHPDIERLAHSKSEADRRQCIPLLQSHLKQAPEDALSWFDLACCFDFLGYEQEAEPNYRKVWTLGVDKLPLNQQKSFFVGYGSTLRNNKKFDESIDVLRRGIDLFPEYIPLQVFLGFSLYSQGSHRDACELLLKMAASLPTSTLDGYERAIKWYAENLSHPVR